MQTLKYKFFLPLALLLFTAFIFLPKLALAANCTDQTDTGVQKCLQHNQIIIDLNNIVNFLSAAVGIVIIAVIIIGGIQYSLAGDNPTATGAAKKRIANGLVALMAFIFTWAFLQWLIPGGIFS